MNKSNKFLYCLLEIDDISEVAEVIGVCETKNLAEQLMTEITTVPNLSISRIQFDDIYEEMLKSAEYHDSSIHESDIDILIKLHPEIDKNELIKANEIYTNWHDKYYNIIKVPYYGINS